MENTVFVLLGFAQDATEWQAKWLRGEKGLNPELPYEYNLASEYGMAVTYSKSYPENIVQKLMRLGFRAILGFDIVHAWRNRAQLMNSDIVWTHTETQALAVCLLRRLMRQNTLRPALIAQSIWLFDNWARLPLYKKKLYRWLFARADVLTVHSPLNKSLAEKLFPQNRVEIVRYGIKVNFPPFPKESPAGRKTRVVSIGNDRHRDWATLLSALNDAPDIDVRIATPLKLTGGANNVAVRKRSSKAEILDLYEWADVVVLALKPNFHASGLTVTEESAMLGVPVVCTKVGGIDYYFRDGEVYYVEPSQPNQLVEAVRTIAGDDTLRQSLIDSSKRRLIEAGLTSRDFVKKHVELSREVLGLEPLHS
jgi:glycosyltransferase involved in cell wall biosynthesis